MQSLSDVKQIKKKLQVHHERSLQPKEVEVLETDKKKERVKVKNSGIGT